MVEPDRAFGGTETFWPCLPLRLALLGCGAVAQLVVAVVAPAIKLDRRRQTTGPGIIRLRASRNSLIGFGCGRLGSGFRLR